MPFVSYPPALPSVLPSSRPFFDYCYIDSTGVEDLRPTGFPFLLSVSHVTAFATNPPGLTPDFSATLLLPADSAMKAVAEIAATYKTTLHAVLISAFHSFLLIAARLKLSRL